MAACAQGKRVRFWRVTELITTLREADQERHLLRLRQQLAKLDLLILDELGYVPASKAGAELLFDVIATAYERTSVILTTNLPFENWTEVLGSERLTGAALDRLTHRCHIVETTGRELPPAGRQAATPGKSAPRNLIPRDTAAEYIQPSQRLTFAPPSASRCSPPVRRLRPVVPAL